VVITRLAYGKKKLQELQVQRTTDTSKPA
jgi:hypothetical protein